MVTGEIIIINSSATFFTKLTEVSWGKCVSSFLIAVLQSKIFTLHTACSIPLRRVAPENASKFCRSGRAVKRVRWLKGRKPVSYKIISIWHVPWIFRVFAGTHLIVHKRRADTACHNIISRAWSAVSLRLLLDVCRKYTSTE